MFEWVNELQASMGMDNMPAREADFRKRITNRANLRRTKCYEQYDFFEKAPRFCEPYEPDKLTELDHLMGNYFKNKFNPNTTIRDMYFLINGSTIEYFDETGKYTHFPFTLGPTYEMLKRIARMECENLSVNVQSCGSITWEVTIWLDLK